MRLRTPLVALGSAALALGLLTAGTTPAATGTAGPAASAAAEPVLDTYLRDTWKSFTAMVDPGTGLVSDNVGGDLAGSTRAGYTSPTNIGAYLWSTVVAQDTGLITLAESRTRIRQTLATLATLEKHEPSGMFYNWYDPKTGAKLTTWPEGNHDPVYPFLSSVDNGWLATGLLAVARSDPRLAGKANPIRSHMDFSFSTTRTPERPPRTAGPSAARSAAASGSTSPAPPVRTSLPSSRAPSPSTRPATATARSTPSRGWRRTSASPPARSRPSTTGVPSARSHDNCDWSWTETKPVGSWATYDGIPVFEGALPYRDMNVVPTWGGSMFEALMVPLFVPEEKWGPQSWGVNHPLYVRGQIEHGIDEADYGYWGFSPSNNPAGGYREYGVDQLGMEPNGLHQRRAAHLVDQPFGDCPDRAGHRPDGVQQRCGHAARVLPRLPLRARRRAGQPGQAAGELRRLRPRRFLRRDRDDGTVSKRYLSLDQGMIMAALGNALAGDDLRRYVSKGAMQDKLEPMMRQEVFSAGVR